MDALPQVGQKYQHKKWGEVSFLGFDGQAGDMYARFGSHRPAENPIGKAFIVDREEIGSFIEQTS